MTEPRLFHMGGMVVDFVYRIAQLPTHGSESMASAFDMVAGGGFNAMVAASRTGMTVLYGGGYGSGPGAAFLGKALDSHNIGRLQPPTKGIDSGTCVVMVTDDAERTFVSWPGADGVAHGEILATISPRQGDWVLVSGYTLSYPGSRDALASWIDSLPVGIALVFDPGPLAGDIPPGILRSVLRRVTWLSCNLAEAEIITGCGDPQGQTERLTGHHCPGATGVVIRAGKAGSFVKLGNRPLATILGFKVTAIDTNGAGDIYTGAFVSALSRHADPMDAARYASAAAAISVTRFGGASAPTDLEIRDFLEGVGKEDPDLRIEETEIQRNYH